MSNDLGLRRFVAAGSDHPDITVAAGETVGAAFEAIDCSPELVILTMSGAARDRWSEVSGLVAQLLQPELLLALEADAVSVGGRTLGPDSVALWAAADIGHCGAEILTPGRPAMLNSATEVELAFTPAAADLQALLDSMEAWPARPGAGRSMLGGATTFSGRGRIELDGKPCYSGALLQFSARTRAFACEGLEPLGPAITITEAEANLVLGMDGRPAAALVAGRRAIVQTLDGDSEPQLYVATSAPLAPSVVETIVAVRHVDEETGIVVLDEALPLATEVRLLAKGAGSAVRVLEDALSTGGEVPAALGAIGFSDTSRLGSNQALGYSSTDSDASTVCEYALVGEDAGSPAYLGLWTPVCVGPADALFGDRQPVAKQSRLLDSGISVLGFLG